MVQSAYFKNAGEGGGTAVISGLPSGVRRAPHGLDVLDGRATMAIADCGCDVLLCSFYGISSAPAAKQIPLWASIAYYIRYLGIPFIWAGDWNAHPDVIRRSGLLELLEAEIHAPKEPTCANGGGIVDFCLVSRSLGKSVRKVEVLHGSRLTPHLPVRLTMDLGVQLVTSMVIPRPRPLPVDRPIGPQLPGAWIDWEGWRMRHGEMLSTENSASNRNMEHLFKCWYAGAEAELNTKFGIFGTELEGEYLGMGSFREPEERVERGRYRDTPMELGLLGHRLAWASRALSTAVRYAQWL